MVRPKASSAGLICRTWPVADPEDTQNEIRSGIRYTTLWDTEQELSSAKPDEYLDKPYITKKEQTMGHIFAADSICASRSILKQSCLKTRAATLNNFTRKTVFNAKWLFKVICVDVDEKPFGGLHTLLTYEYVSKFFTGGDISVKIVLHHQH